ncbi:hypothetical protein [Streptomyces sp. NPDC048442]|uniref:hypothetical protein n=1 Tax=Streptomyces sp. NPDC048442 TaxID=3154823 RepID=UPI00341DF487
MIAGALLALCFLVCALLALVGLLLVVPRDVPPIAGTCAFVFTLAALAVAILFRGSA